MTFTKKMHHSHEELFNTVKDYSKTYSLPASFLKSKSHDFLKSSLIRLFYESEITFIYYAYFKSNAYTKSTELPIIQKDTKFLNLRYDPTKFYQSLCDEKIILALLLYAKEHPDEIEYLSLVFIPTIFRKFQSEEYTDKFFDFFLKFIEQCKSFKDDNNCCKFMYDILSSYIFYDFVFIGKLIQALNTVINTEENE